MKNLLFIAVLAGMILAGCDKIKDATSRDITVDNVEFEFAAESKAEVAAAPLRSNNEDVTMRAETNSFTVTRDVKLAEIGSPDVVKYAGKISKVLVKSALIRVTTTPPGNFNISNLTVKTEGIPVTLSVPSFTTGGTIPSSPNINTYTTTFIDKLLEVKSLKVTVSGKTDAPAGTIIKVYYVNNLVLTASLL